MRNYYKVGGSVDPKHQTYVTRTADIEIQSVLKLNELCFVLNARQMGKSSLRISTSKQLVDDNILCLSLDLSGIDTDISTEDWCKGFCRDLFRVFRSSKQHQGNPINLVFNDWWKQYLGFTNLQKLRCLFEDIILEYSTHNIIIFLDEIDALIENSFKNNFFRFIRSLYNARADAPKFNRLNFCLLGVASPSDLIQDKLNTPFNIGHLIELRGFTFAEAEPLLVGLSDVFKNPKSILEDVLCWTGGQPFLTQKICDLLTRYPSDSQIYVEQLVHERIINNWEYNDDPQHLRTIRDRLLYDPDKMPRLMDLYDRILKLGKFKAAGNPEETDLKLSGLVVQTDGMLKVCNPIYEKIFNRKWIQTVLEGIRPYGNDIKRWEASGCKDSSRLLRGEALVEAKTWSTGKNLSPLDYKFLAASQDDERQLERLKEQASKVKLQQILLGTISIGFLITLILGAITYGQYRQADLQEFRSVRLTSEALYQAGNELDALVKAIQAYGKWHDSGTDNTREVDSTESLLRQAIYGVVEKNRFVSHQRGIWEVAYSANSTFIASASADSTVKLWKPDGTLLRTLVGDRGQPRRIYGLAISPDSQTIVSADRAGKLTLWQVDGTRIKTYPGHPKAVRAVAFSRDGTTIASASDDKTVKLWTSEGKPLATLKGHQRRVNDVAFSPNAPVIASASWDQTIRIWNRDGTPLNLLIGHIDKVFCLDFSPDGQMIASAGADKTLRLWTLDGTLIRTIQAHEEKINALRFSPDGQFIATVSDDKTIKIWTVDGTLVSTFDGGDEVSTTDFSPDGHRLISAAEDGIVRVWQLQHPMKTVLRGHNDVVRGVAISPDGQTIASSSWDQTIKLWRPDGTLIRTFQGHQDGIRAIAFSPDSQWLVSASDDRTLKLWRINGSLAKTLEGHRGRVRAVAFSPTGQWFVSASDDRTINVWTLDGTLTKTWQGHPDLIRGIAVSPDGQMIASVGWEGQIKLWQPSGTLIRTLRGHTESVKGIAFSPDGKTLASASWDQTVKLWRIDGTLLKTFRGHKHVVKSVAFSPDGRMIASTSDDQTIKLWDIRSRTHLASLSGHGDQVWDVTFSPTENRLASVGGDKVILWDLDEAIALDSLLIHGCNWVRDYLSTNASFSEEDRSVCNGI